MKTKLYCLLLLGLLSLNALGQTVVNNGVFGQNANLTYQIGVNTYYGELDNYWPSSNPNNVFKESGVTYVRYSGIVQENSFLIDGDHNDATSNIAKTIADYVAKAKNILNNSQVPMFLLPLNNLYESPWNSTNLGFGATYPTGEPHIFLTT